MPILRCEEKVRLLMAYQKATASHSNAIAEMIRMGISEEVFKHLRETSDKLRKASMAAREELDRHIKEHSC